MPRQIYDLDNFNKVTNNKDKDKDRVAQMSQVQKEALELFKKKNQDYGDAFANYGTVGVLVRMGDKIARLQSITQKSVTLVNTESLRDTLIDLHNYSAMAVMLIDEIEEVDLNSENSSSPILQLPSPPKHNI
jgi:uncharacterized membrane protein YgaE (UPF0421/DUF939 family)